MQEPLGGCVYRYIRDAGCESRKNDKHYQQSLLGIVIYPSSQSFEAEFKPVSVLFHAGPPVIGLRVPTLVRGKERMKIQFTLLILS